MSLTQPRLIALLATLAATACAHGEGDDVTDAAGPDGSASIDAKIDPIDAEGGTPDAEGDTPDAQGGTPDAQSGSPDANDIDAGSGGGGDTCAEAIDLTAAASAAGGTTEVGDSTGYANMLEPPDTCTDDFGQDGPDVIYYVDAVSGNNLTVVLTPQAHDGAVYILSNCDDDTSCVAGADAMTGSQPETLDYAITADGTYYIVVDSYIPSVYGAYTLAVTLE